VTEDNLLSDLEGTCNMVLQKIRFLRLAKTQLAVFRNNGLRHSPSSVRRADEEVERADRVLAKVVDELVEYANKVAAGHSQNGSQNGDAPVRAIPRHATRGD
jgi:hypothetical protein